MRQAARHVSRFYELYLSQAGVTLSQFCILRSLGDSVSTTMAELARATATDRTTLVRTLKPLLRAALIVQAPSDGARRQRLALTLEGQRRLGDAMGHWRAAQAAFESRFGLRRAQALDVELFAAARECVPEGASA